MREWFLLVAMIFIAACESPSTSEQMHQEDDLTSTLAEKKLMFLGAHPDDEWVLMPILAEACLFNGASCRFVSVTPAEWGCFETIGETDIAACAERRKREFVQSAAIANGKAEVLDWEDLFYSHSAVGVRRSLQRWAEVKGGRNRLVEELTDVLKREQPDVVFGLDPRHGATCNPNHRAASLLLIEAVDQLDSSEKPRVLFENTFAVFEHMTPEMLEASDGGAMFAWPDRADPNLYYDANRILPNGRRAIEYQIDSLRAHASQFPGLPDVIEVTADATRLRIPVVDLEDIDPALELCSPLDLLGYKTVDVTLEHIGRQILASAEMADQVLAVRLLQGSETIISYGNDEDHSYSRKLSFPNRNVSLFVGASSQESADAALVSYTRLVKRFTDAPD